MEREPNDEPRLPITLRMKGLLFLAHQPGINFTGTQGVPYASMEAATGWAILPKLRNHPSMMILCNT